jgi:hypothetical protein
MDDSDREKPLRQAAGTIGGFLIGFVAGDGGVASNGVGTIALALGAALLGFALVR